MTALTSMRGMLQIAWRTSRRKMAVSIVLMALGGASWPLLALALKIGVNAALAGDTAGTTVAAAFIVSGLIGALILQHFAYVPYAEATEMATIALEAELIELANTAPGIEQYESAEYADKIELLKKGMAEFHDGMLGLMSLVSLVTSVVLTGLLLVFVNPWLLLLPLAALPPVLASQRAQRIVNRAKEESAGATRQASHLFGMATSARPAKEVRLFRLQSELRRRHATLWQAVGAVLWRAERRAALVEAGGQLVFGVAYVGAVLLVLRDAITGHAGVGDVVLVIVLAVQVNQQVTAALDLFRKLQRMAQGMTRLHWLRQVASARADGTATATVPDRIRSGIELAGVSFTYPGTAKPVLHGVDLRLPAGSTVAIVGENGAGKTTLINLLCGFYRPTGGRILVDGVDLTTIPAARWRARLATAFQDFVRFELPAGHVVGVGDLPRRDDAAAVRAALGRARAEDVVDRLADGLATQVGKSWTEGVELSGGQWQKLAVGRAMMRGGPLLLVLDEPASALDPQAEHVLFERYAENARRVGAESGAVTVFVSHRFSTVRMADLIVVLSQGRVTEVGSHQELMARDGLYAELFGIQARAYAGEAAGGADS
ncbi:ABC transporter ATP-binding protein [Micromonospora sp. NPDC049891]|uniref:ABC transporter ATP-binding protein n=1 Tax=Micromonospora sp. NPDC049891 TaxID=3155655 RepID=UPI0033CC39E4